MGSLPRQKEIWTFVENEKNSSYDHVKSLVNVILGPTLPSHTTLVIALQFILSDPSSFSSDLLVDLKSEPPPHLLSLAQVFLDICHSEQEAFLVFHSFVLHLHVPLTYNEDFIKKDVEFTLDLLKVQEPGLFDHLVSLELDGCSAFGPWFMAFFSNVLPFESLEGLYDIVIADEQKVLCYVCLSILVSIKFKIQTLSSASDVYEVLNEIDKYIDPNAIANTAVCLWERPILDQMNSHLIWDEED